jgi:hypothetical protein
MSAPLSVLALGDSLLGGDRDLRLAVHEVYRWYRAGHRVLVVAATPLAQALDRAGPPAGPAPRSVSGTARQGRRSAGSASVPRSAAPAEVRS